MNEENRKRVLKYIEGKEAPVRFGIQLYSDPFDKFSRKERIRELKELRINAKKISLRNMVIDIINLAESFGTRYVKAGRIQCKAGSRRSCLDIWKIALNYRPEVSIFDIMHELYSIAHDEDYEMVTSWCKIISRRTFRFDNDREIYNDDIPDEFGLYFNDWKSI